MLDEGLNILIVDKFPIQACKTFIKAAPKTFCTSVPMEQEEDS